MHNAVLIPAPTHNSFVLFATLDILAELLHFLAKKNMYKIDLVTN